VTADPEPLLLLPGLGCDRRLWAYPRDHLHDVARPHEIDMLPDHADVRAMAAAILADAPPRFALAGLSMGGYVAFEILRQAPERVVRLALLDTKADLDPPEVQAARQRSLEQLANGQFETHIDERLPLLLGPRSLRDPELVETTRSMACAVGPARYRRQLQAIVDRPDSRPTLRSIACPTLLLCGRDDALTPRAEHESMAAAIAGSRLTVIDDCGHLSTLERPEAVTAALRDWIA
jgi:pimeloyl-ACP methyl ester carboxylesterase